MKLHLGSGGVVLDGWVNVDRRYLPGVDRVDNIGILQHIEPASVDEIYSCHALDHFDRWTYRHVLCRWWELLKPGGELRVSLPDFKWTAAQYAMGAPLSSLIGQLYAGQDYPENVRHWAWDFETAEADLKSVGFERVGLFVPFAEDASKLVDSAGRLRSLNVRAMKPAT